VHADVLVSIVSYLNFSTESGLSWYGVEYHATYWQFMEYIPLKNLERFQGHGGHLPLTQQLRVVGLEMF
jgi:hypothetical protein